MSDDSDDDYAYFGTPVAELDVDEIRRLKAPRIEDQYAKDKQGRRRFHGAFSGGFSAGYFNSVGSKEGWTPAAFVSSREQRAGVKAAQPVDFMDDEDLSSFGIAPQGIQATSSYDANEPAKRKRVLDPDGPIPGVPVLEDIVTPSRETVGMKILQRLGWRQGQGVGPRLRRTEKVKAQKDNKRMYGCQLPPGHESDDEDEDSEGEATFAPDDVATLCLARPKADTFGLGYSPLDRTPVLAQHINLFEPTPLNIREKKKKVLIKGQAFGVGAFEDDDEDIYAQEDMSNYDFGEEQEAKKGSHKAPSHMALLGLSEAIEGFSLQGKPPSRPQVYPRPDLPRGYVPHHQPRRRRFERKEHEIGGLGRHSMTSHDRARLIGESSTIVEVRSGVKGEKNVPESADKIDPKDTSDIDQIFEEYKNSNSNITDFKPFAKDSEKQRRYDLYLRMKEKGQKDRFYLAQPRNMTEWEREREIREFTRAAHLFQPLTSNMASRFVSAVVGDSGPVLKDGLNTDIPKLSSIKAEEVDALGVDIADERVKAAKMNMFGKLTQYCLTWHPDRLLCRRFNVPNPYPDSSFVGSRKTAESKFNLFNALNAPVEDTAGLQESTASQSNQHSQPRQPSPDTDHSLEKHTEDYGIKVPVDGPPTMDLFKAIFQDSDSDSDGADSDSDKSRASDSSRNEADEKSRYKQHRVTPNVSKDDDSSVANLISSIRNDKSQEKLKKPRVSRFEPMKGSEVDEQPMPKPVFISRKDKPSTTAAAKGIFANIDFEALNSYRKQESQPAPTSHTKDTGELDDRNKDMSGADVYAIKDTERKTITVIDSDSSVNSEDEYGPAIPQHLKGRNQEIRTAPAPVPTPRPATHASHAWVVKGSKTKSKKKDKHKDKHKHKKEKKKKKKKQKDKKHGRRARSNSSSSNSSDSD